MDANERQRCIEAVASLVQIDPDNTVTAPQESFLPLDSTRRALAPDMFIVLGSRGAGKTALFRMVTDPQARAVVGAAFGLSLERTQWIRCFAAQGTDEPDLAVLEDLAEHQDLDLRALWACLLVRSLARSSELALPDALAWIRELDPNDIKTWIPQARAALGGIITALDGFDRALQQEQRTVFCCYDALDRISPFNRDMRRKHLRVLLALWSSLSSRYRALRAKIFLREDLIDARNLEFPDASKLLARSTSLDWSHEDITRLLVRYLAAHSDEMRTWLGKVKGLELREDPALGWLPGPIPAAVRKAFTTRLTGLTIGTGIFRVESGRWITGRLEDTNRKITPRTALRFFGRAGQESLRRAREEPRRSSQLLDHEDLSVALHSTSHYRVDELLDDYPVVSRVLNLIGLRLPIDHDTAISHLARPTSESSPDLGTDGKAILDELKKIGVASVHRGFGTGDVVDIPDIYRFGLGIEADYTAAFNAYIIQGPNALHWLQRGDLPHLAAVLAEQLDDSAQAEHLERAQRLAFEGKPSQALAQLENLLRFAQHKQDFLLQWLALAQMSHVAILVDLRLSIERINDARGVMEQQPHLPNPARMRLYLDHHEVMALLLLGELDQVRARPELLGDVDASDPVFGNYLWLKIQLALRAPDPRGAEALIHELIAWGNGRDELIHAWRGYMAMAALVLLSGAPAPPPLKGFLPWAIDLTGIDAPRRHLAILLALAPLGESEPSSIERQTGEHFAAQLLATLGEDRALEPLQHEATRRRATLLDEAVVLVKQGLTR